MANTYVALATVTVGAGGAANITFSSIPQTYTDLVVLVSVRASVNNGFSAYNWIGMRFNGNSSLTYTGRHLYENGGGTASFTTSDTQFRQYDFSTTGVTTANVFNNSQYYIPNYTSSNTKTVSVDSTSEHNNTGAARQLSALTVPLTTGITSISIYDLDSNLVQHSSATLYGIKKS